jgi:ABC-type branched-subunit amino acid transport system substrate-binding protein/predicted negative regulator of RcsB-dependent stress response
MRIIPHRIRETAFVVFLLLASAVCSVAVSQESVVFNPESEQDFQQALHSFSAGEYDAALKLFLRVAKEMPSNHRTTAAYLMAAKAHFRIGSYRESVRLLRTFLDLYPESLFADDVSYSLGLNFYQQGRYEEAAREFLNALESTDDKLTAQRSEVWLEKLANSPLTIGHLQLLLGETKNDEAKALLTIHLAEKILRLGDTKAAEDALQPVIAMPATNRYVGQAISLLERIRKGGVLKIGVILPLMQKSTLVAEKEAGEDLLEGIKLATEEYNQIAIPKVSLDIRDSERDPSIAVRQTAELSADEDVVAIVGPAFSNEAILSGSIASSKGVALISPTATANGIAAAGKTVFQANPDFNIRGRALAQFATEQISAKTIAVLAPNDEIGRALVEAFLDELKSRNADVVDVQWYESSTTDLRRQLMAVRQKAFARMDQFVVDFSTKLKTTDLAKLIKWGVAEMALDSMVERGSPVSVNVLFGTNGKRVADSLRIPVQAIKLKTDSLTVPVRNIDLFFLPISNTEEIGVVSSQVRYFNFQATLLGGGEWNDPVELEQNRAYTNGILFPSDSYWKDDDPEFRDFSDRYTKAFSDAPTKNVLYSYDVMKALLKVIADGARQRRAIVSGLASLRDFQGIHSRISFTSGRVNGMLSILQYKNRSIAKIGEIDYTTGRFSPSPK